MILWKGVPSGGLYGTGGKRSSHRPNSIFSKLYPYSYTVCEAGNIFSISRTAWSKIIRDSPVTEAPSDHTKQKTKIFSMVSTASRPEPRYPLWGKYIHIVARA